MFNETLDCYNVLGKKEGDNNKKLQKIPPLKLLDCYNVVGKKEEGEDNHQKSQKNTSPIRLLELSMKFLWIV